MPELPEVETIAIRLNTVLSGKVIEKITVLNKKSFQGEPVACIGSSIVGVSRRAKLLRFHLKNTQTKSSLNLLAHLKMTGQFIFVGLQGERVGGGHPTADWVQALPSKYTRVVFDLVSVDGAKEQLFFNDMRIFGWIKVATGAQVADEYMKYAPDINTKEVTLQYFSSKLQKTSRPIKQVIMDNKIISGVGNIYACDGLNLAQIHPQRPAKSLTKAEVEKLLLSVKQVVDLGIQLGGATIDNYRTVDGFAGKYQDVVLTYGREGKACKQCNGVISKIKLAGRGTYFCANCQK